MAAHHLSPVRGQSLHVLRTLTAMLERMVQLRVGETACVVCGGEGEKRRLATRELE